MTDPLAGNEQPRRRSPRQHRALRAAGLLLTGGLLGGGLVLTSYPHTDRSVTTATRPVALAVPPTPPAAAPVTRNPVPAAGPVAAEQVAPASTAPPASVDIPTIKAHSALVDLHLDPDGTLQAPPNYAVAGWYSDGALPGDIGAPAVILGHVDSTTGPAIFYRLSSLRPGDPVLINRTDGTQLRFEVYAAADYAKDAFPADSVYAVQPQPELRLITCTGTFDRRHGHYLANHVVYAHEVPTPPAPPAAPAPAPPAASAPPVAPAPAAPNPAAPALVAPAPAAAGGADAAEAQRVLKQFADSTDLAERRGLLQRYAALLGRPAGTGS